MKILIFLPHDTLFGPQGHTERLLGVLSLLQEEEITLLIPESVPENALENFSRYKLHKFPEPMVFRRGIPYLIDFSKKARKSIMEAVEKSNPDVVFFDFPWGLAGFKQHSSRKAIYLAEGVERDFAKITARHFGLNYFLLPQIFSFIIHKLEARACRLADCIFTISETDLSRFRELYNLSTDKLWYLSQPVPLLKETLIKSEARQAFNFKVNEKIVVFHGSWNHLPNREAILLIRDRIAPVCNEINPQIRFIVCGPAVPPDLGAYVTSLGFVEDLATLLIAADAAIVPITSGSGVRMKIFDYFRAGCPVVSTKKGAEGLAVTNEKELLITGNNAEDVAHALLRLLSEPGLSSKLALGAMQLLKNHHDPNQIAAALSNRIGRVLLPSRST